MLTYIPKADILDKNNKDAVAKATEARRKRERAIDEQVELFVVPESEVSIFRYQFILNYMSKPSTTEKLKFIMRIYGLNPSWKDTVFKELLPTLQMKKTKNKVETQKGQQV